MNHFTYLCDGSERAYIIADTQKKRITYFNKVAKKIYHITETTYSLEDMFQNCPMRLEEMIAVMVKRHEDSHEASSFPDLYTLNEAGEEHIVDLVIGFLSAEKTEIFFEFTLKTDERERSLRHMIDHASKPMFMANPDDDFTLYYGNDLFYGIFSSDKTAFSTYYKNSFLSCLLDINKEDFVKEVYAHLKTAPDFRVDLQVTSVHGAKKWFLFDVQYQQISKNTKMLVVVLLPIAERVEVKKQLDNINGYFDAIQELTQGALFYVDVKSKTARHHSKLLKKAGFPERMDHFPSCVLPMFHPDDRDGFLEQGNQILAGNRDPYDVRYRTGTNTYSWARVEATPILESDGTIKEVVGRIQNIDAEKELVDRATIDPLTNAFNKEYAREMIELAMAQAQPDTLHAFFFMDLDNFKYVNDHLGHSFGDFLLQELGKRLREQLRSDDIIGRVGGDEFIFFLKNVKKLEILLTKANNILETIGTSFNDGTTEHTIHGSIGIAVYPLHGKTYEDLYLNADLALYRSKDRGKNMATIYKPPLPKATKKKKTEEFEDYSLLRKEFQENDLGVKDESFH